MAELFEQFEVIHLKITYSNLQLPQQPRNNDNSTSIFKLHQHIAVLTADAFIVVVSDCLAELPFVDGISVPVTVVFVFHNL